MDLVRILGAIPGPIVFGALLDKTCILGTQSNYAPLIALLCGGAVASWLVCSTSDRVVRVRALVEDIVLCSWARYFTLTVPLSAQVYHEWVPANLMLGVTL